MKIRKSQLIACWLASYSLAYANPSNPTTIQGNADFEQVDANTLMITASDKAHIFWGDFSIGENEVAQIVQPSADSFIVIQVESNLPSMLLGMLKANGHVFLINPNGTCIGSNGYIEANAFFASTIPTCACVLLDGQEDIYFQGEFPASIVNNGRIKAWNSDVFLIGHQIQNTGAIDAQRGTVGLAAGHKIIWKPHGNQRISILSSSMEEENEGTGIDNSGIINACRAELKVDGNLYSVAIRHAGIIESVGTDGQMSEIHLVSDHGSQGIFGALTSENVDGTGGTINILGENVALFESTTIDVSGDKGGGLICIGSGCLPELPNALSLFIDEDVVITADALQEGNGGIVTVKADERTTVFGTISVCGGDNFGDGGRIEVYGKDLLDFKGEVDLTAPKGAIGTLQLN